jgi:integrase
VDYGLIARNPARGKARKLTVGQPRRAYLDRADQIAALLDAAGELDREARTAPGLRRAMLATLIFGGLRLGEALALRWRDVDLAAGRLHVTGAKTDAGVREVGLRPVLRDELTAYRAASGSPAPHTLVFPTASRHAWGQSNVRIRLLTKAIERANARRENVGLVPLPEGLTPHSIGAPSPPCSTRSAPRRLL